MRHHSLLLASMLIGLSGPVFAGTLEIKLVAPIDSLASHNIVTLESGLSTNQKIAAKNALTGAFAKDEARIATYDKLIVEEAKLTYDKQAVSKADDLVQRDEKLLSLARKTGSDPKVLKQLGAALKADKTLQTPLLADDRKVELKRDDVALKGETYDVAILPHLGAVLALPTAIENVSFWKRAADSGEAVVFYDQTAVDFKVAPQEVLKLDEEITRDGDALELNPDVFLKKTFSEARPMYEKFGEAGLFADLLAIQPYDKAAGFKSDVRRLDTLIVDLADRRPVEPPVEPGAGAVPEPSTWALMLVGFGGLGAVLRRRQLLVAA